MKSLVIAAAALGFALPVMAEQGNMNSTENYAPTQPQAASYQAPQSSQDATGYGGAGTMGTMQTSQMAPTKSFKLTPEQQQLYHGN